MRISKFNEQKKDYNTDFIKSALEELNDDPLTNEISVKKCWFDNGIFSERYGIHPSNLKSRLEDESFDDMIKTNPPTEEDIECCPGILEEGHKGYVIDVEPISGIQLPESHYMNRGFKYCLEFYKNKSDFLQKIDDFIEISKKKYKHVRIYYSQGSIWIYP